MVLPNLQFLGESIRNGFVPTIHPRRGAGTPFLADPQTSALYPPGWFFSLFEQKDAFRLHQFCHLFWLALGWALVASHLGSNLLGIILTGVTAASAQPHLHGLEWTFITAGASWVPWSFFFALRGFPRLWGMCITMSILSGHAYLWVMAPLLALFGIAVSPKEQRKVFLLCLFLIPSLTAPAWIGYMTLTAEMKPHGLHDDKFPQITVFEPRHLAQFLIPKFFRDFKFRHLDGKITSHFRWGDFGWARNCYVGLLPILLFPIAFIESPFLLRMAIVLLAMGGFVFASCTIFLRNFFSGLFQHIHHPASFIQLAVWGILFSFPIAWKKCFPEKNESSSSKYQFSYKYFFFFVFILTLLCFVGHLHFSELALYDEMDPIWNFSYRIGWKSYLFCGILCLVMGLIGLKPVRAKKKYGRFLLGVLVICHFFDLSENNFWVIPITAPKTPVQKDFFTDLDSSQGKIWISQKALSWVHGSMFHGDSDISLSERNSWIANTSFPNLPAMQERFQLNDYNPPFANAALAAWLNKLEKTKDSRTLNFLLSISGVEFAITEEQFSLKEPWKIVAGKKLPGQPLQVQFWKTSNFSLGTLMSLNDLRALDSGFTPKFYPLPVVFNIKWVGNKCSLTLDPTGILLMDSLFNLFSMETLGFAFLYIQKQIKLRFIINNPYFSTQFS
ncbi:hypothetical protein HYY75_04785 [bacterium]|nr:hypothetical protein [bacterium]